MAIRFSEFSFRNESNRSGGFVLEVPTGENVLEFPFNPGAFLKLDPRVEGAESARLKILIGKGPNFEELTFEPQIIASSEGNALRNYITALRFQFVDDTSTLSVDTESTLK